MRHLVAAVVFGLVLVLPGTTAAAERPWTIIPGRHVTIVGQQSPKALRRIATEIEQFRAAVGDVFRGAGAPMPTLVYIFDNRRAMEPFVPLHDGRPAALDGYCHCGAGADVDFIVASVAGYAGAPPIVFHEYTHLLVHDAVREVPVWLDEGLAEHYGTFRLRDGGRRVEVGRPIRAHVNALRRGYIPIADLLAVNRSSALYNESDRRSVFYAEAWLLAHYLLVERPNGAAAISRYLGGLASGRSTGQAFQEAFGRSTAEMDRELRQYSQRRVLLSLTYALPGRVDVAESDRARAMTPAETQARLGEVQMRVGRLAEAATRIEAAAAADPAEAQPQLVLALLRLQQQRPAEALPPLRRAAALALDDFLTQYTYALLLLRSDGQAGGDDPREVAHAALTRALAANADSADALGWLAYADIELDGRLPEARAAITRAIELAPGRLDFRLRLAVICLRQGEHAEARRLLTELATVRDEDVARQASGLLAQLDRQR
jgi:tetratricopeptide (TPR) repeat protein